VSVACVLHMVRERRRGRLNARLAPLARRHQNSGDALATISYLGLGTGSRWHVMMTNQSVATEVLRAPARGVPRARRVREAGEVLREERVAAAVWQAAMTPDVTPEVRQRARPAQGARVRYLPTLVQRQRARPTLRNALMGRVLGLTALRYRPGAHVPGGQVAGPRGCSLFHQVSGTGI
jgi:hypothetical protein